VRTGGGRESISLVPSVQDGGTGRTREWSGDPPGATDRTPPERHDLEPARMAAVA